MYKIIYDEMHNGGNIKNIKYLSSLVQSKQNIFMLACHTGKFDLIKWLWEKFHNEIDITYCENYVFRYLCGNGYLDIAKWLWEVSLEETTNSRKEIDREMKRINIHDHDEDAFRWACTEGHLDVVKWLWEISQKEIPINIHIHDDDTFVQVCYNGHIDVAKWMWEISCKMSSPINIHTPNERVFRLACIGNQRDIAIWLLKISNYSTNSTVFDCLPKNVKEWLKKLDKKK